MASLTKTKKNPRDKSWIFSIQFYIDGQRRTIRLGRCGQRAADEFKRQVETLVSLRATNTAPDAPTSAWLFGLPDAMHERLAGVSLATPRTAPSTSPTLGDWLDKYIRQRKIELKPSSIMDLSHTAELLRVEFGADRRIDGITMDDAGDWRASVAARGVSEATIRKHTRNAKTFFNAAVDREFIARNPFRKLPSTALSSDRDRYVTPAEAEAILEACPDAQWRTLFALARFAGLTDTL